MLASDWTALLARELLAELRRAERQRLARLARAQAAGSRRPWARWKRWHAWAGLVQAARPLLRRRLPWRGSASLRRGGEQA
jgi:hypothetical protein